jgi:hypothetical protein
MASSRMLRSIDSTLSIGKLVSQKQAIQTIKLHSWPCCYSSFSDAFIRADPSRFSEVIEYTGVVYEHDLNDIPAAQISGHERKLGV